MTSKLWNWAIVFLVISILIGGLVIWSKYRPTEPLEISLPPEPSGEIYVGGAVNRPGWYPASGQDSLQDVIGAAGGATGDAALDRLELHVPKVGEGSTPQKVDINRADVWLLEALPEIGETTARAIVDYRQKNGPFKSVADLMRIPGIGEAMFQKLKDLITVAD